MTEEPRSSSGTNVDPPAGVAAGRGSALAPETVPARQSAGDGLDEHPEIHLAIAFGVGFLAARALRRLVEKREWG